MALVMCPECGKEISDKASYCIHCGYPIDFSVSTPTTESMSKTDIFKSKRNITSAILIFISLLVVFYGNFLQNYEFISIGRTLSGGVFIFLSMPLCIAAFFVYILPFRYSLQANCVITTLLLLNSLVCQFILLSRFSFPIFYCVVAIFAMIAYVILYCLSSLGIMKNSTPLLISVIVYFLMIGIEMIGSNIFLGSAFARAFIFATVPFVLYCASSFLYIRTNIETAYIARKAKINFEQAQPKQGTSPVHDAPSTGFAILCFCFPIVGLILYCVWKETLPKRAKSAGLGGLLGFIIGAILTILVYVIALLGI